MIVKQDLCRDKQWSIAFLITLMITCITLAGPLLADEALWVDVRTAQEFSGGHVTEAVNIPYEGIVAGLEAMAVEKDRNIFLYCKSGRRAGVALNKLEKQGYTHVVNVGGLEDALEVTQQP